MEKRETIAEQLADFVVRTRYADIPPEVIEFTKHLVLKTVAGMVAGSNKPAGRKMAKIIRSRDLPAEVPVVGNDFRTSLWESVFLNAYLAHASELEDDAFDPEGGSAWDITVIPLLLPIASKLGLSGRRLLEALVVGLEVTVRTGLYNTAHLGIGMFPGSLGSAAAAAKAFGLDRDQTVGAFGHALSSPPLANVNLGTDVHFFESAMMALQGLLAAEAAREGLKGNPDIDSYMTGIVGSEKAKPASERAVANLGQNWMLRTIWLKKYPCCFCEHRAIDLLVEMMAKCSLRYDEVDTIEVHIRAFEAFLDRPHPQTDGDLQFSFQHALAALLMDGDITLEHFTTKAIAEPRYAAARAKVRMAISPDESSGVMGAPAKLVIRTKDGRVLNGQRLHAIGSPEEPLTTDQVKALFYKYTRRVLSGEQADMTIAAITGLEELHNAGEIMIHTQAR